MTPPDKSAGAEEQVPADVPCFAVVGRVNMGKSAVLATLLEKDDQETIPISPEPGETTECRQHSLEIGEKGKERLRFTDTPGFQQPIAALRAIRSFQHDESTPGPDTLRRFVEHYRETREFADERRLLEPLLDGAGILYVVDPARKPTDDFHAEIEILRWSSRKRLGLLNTRTISEGDDHSEELEEILSKSFNLVRRFDANRAPFAARRDLLADLNRIDEGDKNTVQRLIDDLDAQWEFRREQAAELISEFLSEALTHEEKVRFKGNSNRVERARAHAKKEATDTYFKRISELEREYAHRLLEIYKHQNEKSKKASQRKLEDMMNCHDLGEDLDLKNKETWTRFGLPRNQLAWAAAATGAAFGAGADVLAAGMTGGIFTVAFGGSAYAATMMGGHHLPEMKFKFWTISGADNEVVVSAPAHPNFPWVLLDSILVRYETILKLSHGNREMNDWKVDGRAGGIIRNELDSSQQKTLAQWFKNLRTGNYQKNDEAALPTIQKALEQIESKL